MCPASLANQIAYVLDALFWDKEKIEAYKTNQQVVSVKRDLRPGGNPTRALPVILSYRTQACYFQTGITFFRRAKALTGKRLLVELLDSETIRRTLDTYYRDHRPASIRTVLAAVGKIHQGCVRVGWTKRASPVTHALRAHVKAYRDDGDVRQPRFGYLPEDAERILEYLQEHGSKFTLPAKIALRCGLRLSEIAGLKGEQVDLENMLLHVTGKGGKKRDVALPADLADQINPSRQYLFDPSQSWKRAFYRAVRHAARDLGIGISGVHRLRANYAQKEHQELMDAGKNDREARQEVSRRLGHNRVGVTNSYIPRT
jgi:integrase